MADDKQLSPQDASLSVPADYPFGSTDDELSATLGEVTGWLISRGVGPNDALRMGPVISVGVAELQTRESKRILEASYETATSVGRLEELSSTSSARAETYARRSLYLALLAVAISVVGIAFALEDYVGDKDWQRDQIRSIDAITHESTKQTAVLKDQLKGQVETNRQLEQTNRQLRLALASNTAPRPS